MQNTSTVPANLLTQKQSRDKIFRRNGILTALF